MNKKTEEICALLREEFEKRFGPGDEPAMYFAPGRVNLIGEHTDYNGGGVLPCALTMGTWAAVRLRKDSAVRLCSVNKEGDGVFESEIPSAGAAAADGGEQEYKNRSGQWPDYILGVLYRFREHGYVLSNGFDMLIYGTIPSGAGLSSSASLEVVTACMLRDQYGFPVSDMDTALYCQEAENLFVGMNCGIMDQFAVTFGKEDHAVWLETASMKYQHVPVVLNGCRIVIANTNKKHKLTDSAYNDRRRECEEALEILRREKDDIRYLCDLTPEEFEQLKDTLPDPVLVKRARHAVTENARVKEAVTVLNAGDLERFGELMNASHRSLAEDYEVTGKELDALASAAWAHPGCLGSRMTGGGFGGCTVSLVKTEAVDDFVEKTGAAYREQVGYDADFYIAEIGSGPVRIGAKA